MFQINISLASVVHIETVTHPFKLTVSHIIGLLALLVDDDDQYQDDDLGEDTQEGPQGGQVAPDPQDWCHGGGADGVGRVALVLSGVRREVEVNDGQLGVAIPAADEEAARGVVDILSDWWSGRNRDRWGEVKKDGGRKATDYSLKKRTVFNQMINA